MKQTKEIIYAYVMTNISVYHDTGVAPECFAVWRQSFVLGLFCDSSEVYHATMRMFDQQARIFDKKISWCIIGQTGGSLQDIRYMHT